MGVAQAHWALPCPPTFTATRGGATQGARRRCVTTITMVLALMVAVMVRIRGVPMVKRQPMLSTRAQRNIAPDFPAVALIRRGLE